MSLACRRGWTRWRISCGRIPSRCLHDPPGQGSQGDRTWPPARDWALAVRSIRGLTASKVSQNNTDRTDQGARIARKTIGYALHEDKVGRLRNIIQIPSVQSVHLDLCDPCYSSFLCCNTRDDGRWRRTRVAHRSKCDPPVKDPLRHSHFLPRGATCRKHFCCSRRCGLSNSVPSGAAAGFDTPRFTAEAPRCSDSWNHSRGADMQ